ncbi:helix-turn-helix transcriptional regulator [Pseudodonghicola flavimaris]|uniref:YafY family protein n=1 Tax=Pseudodonghicola flavimaris TaxID=3050036 RepID=A0ABT7F799_9RHOB|nr:YafY family protein [Pseudodonghicola flavimaris]MDK3020494.1 YafY family protein [Pseudodonghicola flavimaris]
MAKTDRLFRLLHLIRGLTPPVTAARLAAAMEVSDRTIYRDIETLRAAGARIEGAAGLGYTMTEDPALPPQTFTQLEIEALVLGLSDVQARGDAPLAAAAADALTKITATLPERQQRQAVQAINLVHRFAQPAAPAIDITLLREASWAEEALEIRYRDNAGAVTNRRVHPLALAYLDNAVMLLGWCCLRRDFRQFKVTSILAVQRTGDSFRPHRVPLLRDYVARLRRGRNPAPPPRE